jgi:sulfate transport system ATP-binding protein
MGIKVSGISKSYGTVDVLQDIDLEIQNGELVALLGPSGSGKTTLLRLIAGLEEMRQGKILFDGQDATNLHVRDRQVGFVFQHYALFNHMSVFENISFGLKVKTRKQRPSKEEIRRIVEELIDLVQLNGLENRYPAQLSGGQRQRVALARALAINPKVLLLDEPFGALDAKVRQDLRRWLRDLHNQLHITSIFVTHDQEEALEIADRVVVMNHGKIEQVGTPEEVYHNPANPFVFRFLGRANVLHVNPYTSDSSETGYARPHELDVLRNPSNESDIQAVVKHIANIGAVTRLELIRCDNGLLLEAEISNERYSETAPKIGDKVYVSPRNLRIFQDNLQPAHSSKKVAVLT